MGSIEDILGVSPNNESSAQAATDNTPHAGSNSKVSFSLIFFSDVIKGIADKQKYEFMRDLTVFADNEGFEAVYFPERHFSEFGSIYANSSIICSYLIPQTQRIRFRTAGISLPLHHPAEVVETWAMNDILSDGRVDLGFGSGWNIQDFILAPDNYHNRREICGERIDQVQRLWRGEAVEFTGPDNQTFPIQVFPKPTQKTLNVWLLVAQNEQAFYFAGKQGYNVFTMLYGIDMQEMAKKIALYRKGREEAGLDPQSGKVSLMLHTHLGADIPAVQQKVEAPFKDYIASTIDAHVKAGLGKDKGVDEVSQAEKDKVLEYAYQRYFKTCALFGGVEDCQPLVEQAISAGVNDIVCLMDFGVDYDSVKASLPYLKQLSALY
ncbi:MupA/Atu3671 family FMN-dependent luciferase-like monooxygenase [Alteromonas sp. a30]|uniref:MupA/Atu3671 family FMN-dependent luciferase-like monooxygenase n=1 Tax=Alteromonas sp. a30 TaxID=2730917 RepID=UPI00227FEF84|nr:MupA/Atu3671 family FMN-dependent luciferase-like monooxygenase [Alteromonas sp. a30]MCY7297025.1 LLM class flavin-dependent oxidoreductase [Alteromonas sp. a30]